MHSRALRLGMNGEGAQEAVTGVVDALGKPNDQGLTKGNYVSFDVPDLMDPRNLYPWVKLATALKKMVFEVILAGLDLQFEDFRNAVVSVKYDCLDNIARVDDWHSDYRLAVLGVFSSNVEHGGTEIVTGVAGKLSLSGERQQILTERQGRDLEEWIRGGELETFTTKPGDLTVIGPQTVHRRMLAGSKAQEDRFVMLLNLLHGSEIANAGLGIRKLLKRLEG